MSNSYFNHTSRFVPGTVARAEDVNDVLDSVATGFESVESIKSKRGGDTYTGAHNFTGATMTVAIPSVSSSPVTKLYADNLAFENGVFPDQTGNAGKIISTDGTNSTWQDFDAGTF